MTVWEAMWFPERRKYISSRSSLRKHRCNSVSVWHEFCAWHCCAASGKRYGLAANQRAGKGAVYISLSMEWQCLGPWAEQEHAWFSYFFSSNKSNQRFNAMDVLQNLLSEWFDKVWLSSFSGELPPVWLLLFHCSYKQLLRIFSRNAAPQLKCTGMLKPSLMS